jgi:steroid delta-isomerase
MSDAKHIRAVFEQYCANFTAGDFEATATLFAEDATVEDPIGSPVHRGRDAIRDFYKAGVGMADLELEGAVRVAGHEAAAAMLARPRGAKGVVIQTLDVMTFDDEGLITSMRAYWSDDSIVRE